MSTRDISEEQVATRGCTHGLELGAVLANEGSDALVGLSARSETLQVMRKSSLLDLVGRSVGLAGRDNDTLASLGGRDIDNLGVDVALPKNRGKQSRPLEVARAHRVVEGVHVRQISALATECLASNALDESAVVVLHCRLSYPSQVQEQESGEQEKADERNMYISIIACNSCEPCLARFHPPVSSVASRIWDGRKRADQHSQGRTQGNSVHTLMRSQLRSAEVDAIFAVV